MKYQFEMKKDHQTLSEKIIVSIIKKKPKTKCISVSFQWPP